jgi:hypothetical protein
VFETGMIAGILLLEYGYGRLKYNQRKAVGEHELSML